jgi:hypothetical protein
MATFFGRVLLVEQFASTTIAAKLTNSDGRYSLGLIHPDEALVPHVFPTAG